MKTLLDIEYTNSFETKDSSYGPIINQGTYNGKMILKLKSKYYTVGELEHLLNVARSKESRYKYCKDNNYDKYIESLYPIKNNIS